MGVVNATPDSFSDGGRWLDSAAAIQHGLDLAAAGAAMVDIGGESTRPGAERPSVQLELARVIPVVSSLSAAGLSVSIDTMRAEVAAAAIEAGARLVNDVSGGKADPEMLPLIATSDVDYVLMHWRGHSDVMDARATYGDVVSDVRQELADQVEAAMAAGVAPERIILDVGIGFAKTAAQNWELLAAIGSFNGLGLRQLVGASRKRFLGEVTGRQPQERDAASAAVTMWCAQQGVWAVRTHTVTEHLDAIRVAEHLRRAGAAFDGR